MIILYTLSLHSTCRSQYCPHIEANTTGRHYYSKLRSTESIRGYAPNRNACNLLPKTQQTGLRRASDLRHEDTTFPLSLHWTTLRQNLNSVTANPVASPPDLSLATTFSPIVSTNPKTLFEKNSKYTFRVDLFWVDILPILVPTQISMKYMAHADHFPVDVNKRDPYH